MTVNSIKNTSQFSFHLYFRGSAFFFCVRTSRALMPPRTRAALPPSVGGSSKRRQHVPFSRSSLMGTIIFLRQCCCIWQFPSNCTLCYVACFGEETLMVCLV